MSWMVVALAVPWLVVSLFMVLGGWLGFQLVHQNGRLLSHLEALDQRLGQPTPAPTLAPAHQPAAPAAAPQPAAPPALPLGSPAPDFELPDLNRGRKSLRDFRGRKLLLIFFNPGCG